MILLADEVVGHMREKVTIYEGEKAIRGGHRNYVVSPQEDFYTGGNCLVEGQLHDEEGMRIGHLPSKSGEFIRSICGKIQNHIDETGCTIYFMEDATFHTCLRLGKPVSLNAVKQAKGPLSVDKRKESCAS